MNRDYTLTEGAIQLGMILAIIIYAAIRHLLVPWVQEQIDKDLG